MNDQCIGTVIMGHALTEFYEVVIRTGVFALTLVFIDEKTTQFYNKLGFVKYGHDDAVRPKMLLPAASVLDMMN